jgi:hypothetical protein
MKKLFETEKIACYTKKEFQVGEEVDIVEELLIQAGIGLKTYTSHMAKDEDKQEVIKRAQITFGEILAALHELHEEEQ